MSWWRVVTGPKKGDAKIERITKHMTEISEAVEKKSAVLEQEVRALKEALATERTSR